MSGWERGRQVHEPVMAPQSSLDLLEPLADDRTVPGPRVRV